MSCPQYFDTARDAAGAPDRLREIARAAAVRGRLVVIGNREPYAHERDHEGKIVVEKPASGLVTGVEPILRACGGVWIAHGGGSADRVTSDASGRLPVPPEFPEYTLRRLFFEEEEYERYYSGFANEAIWPLCHHACGQPSFRAAEWRAYESVNAAFARAAIEETGGEGLLLVQDYHFALVPRIVRQRAPRVVTSLFWHIPWPAADVTRILPWREQLLEGMLGADIVGFHTREYCLNFLQTVTQSLPCQVNFDTLTVSHGGRTTEVRPYPISIEWPYPAAARKEGTALRESLGIAADAHVSVAVDRADYTKGLLERIAAVEVLLDEQPSLAGRFVLVQLASPTRTRIPKYQRLLAEVRDAVRRLNERFGNDRWMPVVLQVRTHSPDEVRRYYSMADSALVTPLHDGMNLVAKEYVGSCADGNGALVLSAFAGAADELDGAILVNPYDAEQVAHAILRAMRMPFAEKQARMSRMRARIAAHSIYDWSSDLITDMNHVGRRNAEQRCHRVAVVDDSAQSMRP